MADINPCLKEVDVPILEHCSCVDNKDITNPDINMTISTASDENARSL
jgi:hypothetical protein